MEVIFSASRSIRTLSTKPSFCKHLTTRVGLTSSSIAQRSPQTQSRDLTSTSQNRQDTPLQTRSHPQTEPLSDAATEYQPQSRQQTQRQQSRGSRGSAPDPNNRIDLSPLSNNLRSRSQFASSAASAKLDALLGRPGPRQDSAADNPFMRTIRQTDAMDGISTPPTFSVMDLFDNVSLNEPMADERTTLPLRLRPTLGRTQNVDNLRGMDLTRAFRTLEHKCATNNVKRDLNKQRFHVRRGQRKKLERSLRWRTVFKAGFLEECARIRRMKNQGW